MNEDTARDEILRILKKNDWYAVKWDGHFDRYFVCLKRSENCDMDNDVYGAIYESYYDLTRNDEQVLKISIGYDCKSWHSILDRLKQLPIDFN